MSNEYKEYASKDWVLENLDARKVSWDSLEDKPFGETIDNWVEVIAEATYANNSALKSWADSAYTNFSQTGSYRFTIDGTDTYVYEKTIPAMNMPVGDNAFTNYPFCTEFRGSHYIKFQDGASHTLKVEFLTSVTKSIDDAYIPDTIARVADLDSKADEIHTHSWEELNDKPFYYNETILSTFGPTTRSSGESLRTSMHYDAGTYRVTIDESSSYIVEKTNTTPNPAMGDSQFIQYPFYTGSGLITFKDGQSHTIKIEKINLEVKTLDEKYIPDTIARVSDILTEDEVVQLTVDFTNNAAFGPLFKEAKALIENGKVVILHYTSGPIKGSCIASLVLINDETYLTGVIPTRDGNHTFIISSSGLPSAGTVPYQNNSYRLTSWDSEAASSDEYYPSVKAMEEYMAEHEAPQPDWNAPEGEPGYVLNRTHWVENAKDMFVNTEELTFTSSSNGNYQSQSIYSVNSYDYYNLIIEFDGVVYDNLTYNGNVVNADYIDVPGYGNAYLVDRTQYRDTGEPFYFGQDLNDPSGNVWILYSDSSKSCTFTAYHETNAIHTLDDKFIPATIARVADVATQLTTALSDYYTQAEVEVFHDEIKDYVDEEVAALVNAAPETLDTIGELAAAFEENKEVVEALDASITNKQDKVSDTLILVDTVTGKQHKLQIQNGQLVSFPVEE